MSYLEFKLNLELNQFMTFEKDKLVQKMYKKYVKEFDDRQAKNGKRNEQGTK